MLNTQNGSVGKEMRGGLTSDPNSGHFFEAWHAHWHPSYHNGLQNKDGPQ